MKTNIDLNKDFTMSDVMSTEFFLYFKEYIKKLSEDQKIAKRDRKDTKHPCPDQRKYSPLEAYYKVLSQRWFLSELYEVYYFMKKNRDFDWTQIKFTHEKSWNGKDLLKATYLDFDKFENYRFLKNCDCVSFMCLADVIKEYVENGK